MTAPSLSRDRWPRFEQALRQTLQEAGAGNDMINWICNDLEGRWTRLPPAVRNDVEVSVRSTQQYDASITEPLNAVNSAHAVTLSAAVNMILQLEADLYNATHPPGDGIRWLVV